MSEENLSIKARSALRHIRNWIMQNGKVPSVRELMNKMEYKSPRSAMLLMAELESNGFLKRRNDGSYQFIKDMKESEITRTVTVPLIGSIAAGLPILAEQNVEALIPISTNLVRGNSKYFLLTVTGDSMNLAGIDDGDMILVKQQPIAESGEKVVALIDDEATVKEFHRTGDVITLLPRSTNEKHKRIIVGSNFQIQGIVVATISKITK